MPRNNAKTTRGKPFEPGNAGRPRGARHRVTMAIEALLEGEHELLTRKAVELALGGDVTALRLCLDRIAPPRRDATVTIALPEIKTAEDAVAASTAILTAVAAGDVTPDEASRVMGLLTAHKAIVETADIDRRIAALEAKA